MWRSLDRVNRCRNGYQERAIGKHFPCVSAMSDHRAWELVIGDHPRIPAPG
jgi:hypothetical protein